MTKNIVILIFVFLSISLAKIKKSFSHNATHPFVGKYFFVKCKKIALPLNLAVFL